MNDLDFRALGGDPEDEMFVISQWSRGFKQSRAAGIISDEDWPTVMHAQIRKLVARADVITVLAVEKSDPDFLYGFISATPGSDPPVVHFTYVKESYRKAGYARRLFAAVAIDPKRRFAYSCWTPVIDKLRAKLVNPIPRAYHEPRFARITGYVEEPRRPQQWRR